MAFEVKFELRFLSNPMTAQIAFESFLVNFGVLS
jgi:hypothetical protein